MSTGIEGAIGIGTELAWGTPVASSRFYSAQENITEDRGRLREPMSFGTRSTLPADAGRLGITGGITQMHARPDGIGALLRAAIGIPSTSGAGPYIHLFEPTVDKFSPEAALPPYSATIKRGSLIHQYSGGQLNTLTIRQPADDAMMIDTDWIFKGVAAVAAETVALEAGSRFRFQQLAVTKGGVTFPYLEDLTIGIANNLEAEETLNESLEISAVDFNDKLQITIGMTLTFRDATTYADFAATASDEYVFTWTNGADILAITIPALQLDSWSAPISGPGRMTITTEGTAEFDATAGNEIGISLTNSVATY